MSHRLRATVTIAAVAATAAATLTSAGTATAAPSRATIAPIVGVTTNPAVAAAGWLAQKFMGGQHQPRRTGTHFDGSYPGADGTVYYFDGGTTADAIFALAASGTAKIKIDAAATYLGNHLESYTQIEDTSGAPGPSDGQVAKSALAAVVAGADPTDWGGYNLLQTLKQDECTGESGSSTDFTVPTCPAAGAGRNIFSSVSESLIILAESRVGGQYAPSDAAVNYFLTLQCPNGGFTGLTTPCTDNADASVDETAYAAAALAALGGHESELKAADEWLASTRVPAGYWVVQGGPDIDSTGLATAALAAAGYDVSTSRAWIASQQVTVGPTVGRYAMRGALAYQGEFSRTMSVKATADGLLGLSAHGFLATLTSDHAAPNTRVLRLPVTRVHRHHIARGQVEGVLASGFTGGEAVQARLGGVRVHTATATKMGVVSFRFTVPRSLAPGKYRLMLNGTQSGMPTRATIRVLP